jgi:hypothetical protein
MLRRPFCLLVSLLTLTACGAGGPAAPSGAVTEPGGRLESPGGSARAVRLADGGTLTAPAHAVTGAVELAYGSHSPAQAVRGGDYGWFQFRADAGDAVELTVRAFDARDAQPVVFVFDGADRLIATNVVAGLRSGPAHVAFVAAGAAAYRIAFGDFERRDAAFVVALRGSGVFACAAASDCVAVPKAVCCPHGELEAVNVSAVERYRAANACVQSAAELRCPFIWFQDSRVAACDLTAHRCAMVPAPDSDPPVDVADIVCGGLIPRQSCPDGYTCKPDQPGNDVTGHCIPLP